MTGAGAPGAPGIIKCLLQDDRINLVIADADENAIGKHLHQHFIKIQKASEPDFIESLLKIVQQHSIQCILPLVTKELFPLSENKHKFEKLSCKVLVSSSDSIELANKKALSYQYLYKTGIAIPKFRIAKTVKEFEEAARQLGYPEHVFCFKPSESNGSRGFRIVSDKRDASDLLFSQKPDSTYLPYDQAIKILASKPFPELLVCEYLPGDEYSVDCLAENGNAKLVVPRLRKKMINGISVQGAFEKDEAIITYCTKIIQTLRLHGNVGIQLKRNENGEALLLEINPRVQGTIVSNLGVGVNLPLLAIFQELGMGIEINNLNIRWGTQFSRYWTEVFY
jgi:carbamoyl-phosphate synthase large subunit